jgi:hypothetical protein
MKSALISAPLLAFSIASAQTTFFESEPNSTKAEATLVLGMKSGDSISGTTNGADDTPGSTSISSVDTFLIQTSPLAPGIYGQYLYYVDDAHTGTLRGLNQTGMPGSGGTPGTLDVALQTSPSHPLTPASLLWFGFGKQEKMYVRIQGNGGPAAYTLTLSTVPMYVRWMDNTFQPGPITISTIGMTSVDTDLVLLDSNFDPVPGGTNDDEFPVGSKQSRLTRTLSAGVYYLGIAGGDVASGVVAPTDEGFPTGHLVDFPGAVVASSIATPSFPFTITDGTTTSVQGASQPVAFQVSWFRFTVGAYPATPYCFGDGSTLTCPCGPGAIGHGCPNSANVQGGRLDSTGTASLAADDLKLVGTSLPDTMALYFQSDDHFWGLIGDGIMCAQGGAQIRMGIVLSQGGTSQFPPAGDPPISVQGQIPGIGATRYYQAWYRDPAVFCTSATFNFTNGLRVVWGP